MRRFPDWHYSIGQFSYSTWLFSRKMISTVGILLGLCDGFLLGFEFGKKNENLEVLLDGDCDGSLLGIVLGVIIGM